MNKTLSIAYYVDLQYPIWRMDFHPLCHHMAVETRHTESGLPYFSAFNYESGQLVLKDIPGGDRWWTLAAIAKEHLFLTYYTHPELPNTAALSAISLDSGLPVWEKYNLVMEGQVPDGPIVQQAHMPNGFLSLLDAATGETLKNYVPGQTIPYMHRPVLYPNATEAIPPFISGGESAVGPWHYIRHRDLDCWAVHQKGKAGFQIRLIVSHQQEILHDEVIIDNLAKLLLDLFFIIDDHLFVISGNKRQIIAYKMQ